MMRLQLPREPDSAALARGVVERHLLKRGVRGRPLDLAMLVSSELVTNACKYGEGTIELRLRLLDGHLRIEVIDEGQGSSPHVRQREDDAIGGWGLQIVDQVALEWGVFEGMTHVWADLPLG